ncbi:DUF3024 domain-containing protein [Flavicella sediminum]|uniref:DUF3024 domain-containing protein n=1 Tax=Flavicella sediminum TaxID=2585141 RepID=UPI00111E38C1|nr:DUF3024 domain-containing protein [Flavicella sediminum]
MKVIKFAEIQIKEYVEAIRPPEDFRDQVDVSYWYKNDIIEIFEIRPNWQDEKIKENFPIARTKYVKSKKIWRIYWLTGNQKWIQYKPNAEVKSILEFIEVLKKDKTGCFWG